MTPAKWNDVDRLYHEALARAPVDRAAFLAAACKGDPELRAEVDSLLEYEPHARQFIEADVDAPRSPVADAVRRAGLPLTPGRLAGTAVGAYQIESLVGAGGMGEVYRARDTRLDRIVAIKFLPERHAVDPDRR